MALNFDSDASVKVVEVEHSVEVSEIVRHLTGKAVEIQSRIPNETVDLTPKNYADIVGVDPAAKIEASLDAVLGPYNLRQTLDLLVGPPVDYSKDPNLILAFLWNYCSTVLVTTDEHCQLGKARPGRSSSTIQVVAAGSLPGGNEPIGSNFSRYEIAGIRLFDIANQAWR